jgi:phosphopantothenoylcysteine decarboxylase / phosphopantothenate---cysteine ligase
MANLQENTRSKTANNTVLMTGGNGQKILLGISGSIAAYKVATLIRLLVKQGHEVKCIMTDAATHFISSLTISTLSKNPVYKDFFSEDGWHNHVELGLWADVMLIAPATAHTLSKLANGHADKMLTATYLSAKCPVIIAPAMDLDMWHHGSTLANIEKLKSYGNAFIPVGYGELASGLIGDGRMAEPEDIMQFLTAHFTSTQDLKGKNILITAGPTYEHIDPVRFIGNHSSGKMGIAIANEAAKRGANVHLVLGPSNFLPNPNVKLTKVKSAQEMYEACQSEFEKYDGAIFSAAVADYRPMTIASEKIKKDDNEMTITLQKNIDIAYTLGKRKTSGQVLVGFALETNDEEANALKKIHKKNLDFIVLNSLNDKGAGFGHETNKITIINKEGEIQKFELKAKTAVAYDIVNEVSKSLNKNITNK